MSGLDDLILTLTADLEPAPTRTVEKRLLAFGAAGAAIALPLMLIWLGLRPDLRTAIGGAMFWEKAAFTLAIGAAGALMLERLARPGGRAPRLVGLIAGAAFGLIALQGLVQILAAPARLRADLMMGHSARVCAFYIVCVSAPLLALLLAAARSLAPTRLTLAGLACGMTAGGFGACIYALHCPEAAAPFIAVWYSLGMAASAVLGAFLGRFALSWR